MQKLAAKNSLELLTLAELIRPVISLKETEYRDLFTVLGFLRQTSHVLVLKRREQLRGIITPDILCCGFKPSQLLSSRLVSDVMNSQPLQALAKATLLALPRLMASSGQHCVVITASVGNIPGTGLGLMIVKKCIDLQQDKIMDDSEVGVGTTD